jgi:hypothetical protein
MSFFKLISISLAIKKMIQDLKVFHPLAKMALQQLIKEFLLVVKRVINVHLGQSKQKKLHTIKIKNKFYTMVHL